jgi:hypothetical protein
MQDNKGEMMEYMKNRLTEASTWAAVACFIQLAGKYLPPQYHVVADCVSVSLAAVAGVTPEAK